MKNFYRFNKSVILATTLKNAEKNIQHMLHLINEISSLYKKYFVIIVESDSSDKTKEKLLRIKKKLNFKFVFLNTKSTKFRTQRLSIARNKILEIIKKKDETKNFDHLILFDSDNVNRLINKEKIFDSINKAPKDWVGIFPNQSIFYYDLWGLRIKKLHNFDSYQMLKNLSKKMKSNIAYFKVIFRNFFLLYKFKSRFINVESAWGGMGIYKLKYVLRSKYNSNYGQNNEIVYFNKKILKTNKNRRLYIDKNLINSLGINDHIIKSFFYIFFNYYTKKLLVKKFK